VRINAFIMKTVKEAEPLGATLSWIFTFSTKLKKKKLNLA